MREILFRGRSIQTRNWYCGGILNVDCKIPPYVPMIAVRDDDDMVTVIDADPDTVGQFTGLTDKNGKKIFEGDIGRYKQTDGAKLSGKPITCIGKVVYNTKTASFAVDSKDELGAKNYDYFPIKDFEVIGNIHDNPELPKGE